MFCSVRWRLVASYVLLTAITVSLIGILALTLVRSYVEQQEIASLQATAEAIAHEAEALLWPRPQSAALQDLAQTAAFLGNDQVRILDADERVVADSAQTERSADAFVWLTPPLGWSLADKALRDLLPSWPELPLLLESGLPLGDPSLQDLPADMPVTVVRRVEDTWGIRLIFESTTVGQLPRSQSDAEAGPGDVKTQRQVVTVPVGNEVAPTGFVELTRTSQAAGDALATTRRALMLAGIGAAVLSVMLGLVVGHTLTAPLKSLATVAGQMSQGDLAARAEVRGGVELEQLGRQFNEMASRLEASFADLATERDALRRFIADASHELRTPITAIKNFNELLLGSAAGDEEARREFLGESQAQIERLEWVAGNLLDLSRIDAGLIDLDITEGAAGDLIEAAAAAFFLRAREADIDLVVVAPTPPFDLRCDRTRLIMALSNLLDNALKFTPSGGSVAIGAERVGEATRFWVQDSGMGVAAADQPHIFERFYHGRGGGTGLGLAIVRSIAQAHGGCAYLAASGPEGSRFVIEVADR
ncbi:MAG: HAMP domain-containing histidine kinase [Caldilineales bacterium]|nr:HAMP domain-containing histidine kinase [Caldilineales bacterium]